MPIIDRDTRREHTRRRSDLETEIQQLHQRVDALVEATARMARQHYRSPMLPESSITSALHDARRR